MKRQTIYDLIKAHFDGNEMIFTKNARKIAKDIDMMGDKDLYKVIDNLIKKNSFVCVSNVNTDIIMTDYQRELISVLKHGMKNRIISNLFIYGKPGTGKTAFTHQLAKIANKKLKIVHLSEIIHSKLGESIKELENLFKNNTGKIIFIDEVDSIASSRRNSSDLFEINRVLNTLLKIVDSTDKNTFIVCATNLFDKIDPAFIRRFHMIVNFDEYPYKEMKLIWEMYSKKFGVEKDTIFYKYFLDILKNAYDILTPSSLKNIARIISLWQPKNKIPLKDISEIFSQIGLNRSILEKRKTDNKIINFFIKKGIK